MHTEDLRNAFVDPSGPTLQEVIDRLHADASLGLQPRREMISAMNALCRWLRCPARMIPANPDYLRRAIRRLNHGTLNVSRRRFDNVRSLAKKALAAAGIAGNQHYLAPLTPDWQRLADRIPDPYARQCLNRFMRFAATKGIRPEKVDDEFVRQFHKALVEEDLTARPNVAVQSAVRLWNRMVGHVAEWPDRRLTPILTRETYTLPWSRLRSEFVADVERYLALMGGADPTDELAPPQALKPLSLRTRRYQILQIVSALDHQGEPLDDIRGLADLCDVRRAKLALNYFIARHRQRHGEEADPATSMIGGIADTIRVIAKHYVDTPEAPLRELTRLSSRLNRRQPGMAEKNVARLQQVQSAAVQARLVRHPIAEMNKLARLRAPQRQDAVRYSVLFAMEILLMAPMRVANLAQLDLDKSFGWPVGADQTVSISIPRSSTKNRQDLHYRLLADSAAALRVYLDRFRPLLTNTPSRLLFPVHDGDAKRSDTLSKQIKKLIKSELGIDWHAHLFRHLAAKTYLQAYPGDYEGARRLLAHASAETTYRSYEGMAMEPAVARYDELLQEIRASTSTASRSRRRTG